MRYKRIKKLSLVVLIIMLFILTGVTVVCAETEVKDENALIIDEQLNSGEIKTIEEQLNKFNNADINEIFPDFDPQSIMQDAANGSLDLNIPAFFNKLIMYIIKEIYLNMDLLIKLIVISIVCAILKNLQTSFLSESVGELAFYACYIVIVSIMVLSLNTAYSLGKEIIDSMVAFMHSTIPVLVTLMISGGNIASGGVLQPVLIMAVEIAAGLLRNLFLPLVFFTAVLSIVNNISDKIQISKLAGFIKHITTWSLGIILTIFVAIISLQGSLGAVIDGVTSKTTKFAISTFIPVAGKYLADAADTVIGCTLIIKNAANAAVMIGILLICIVPLLKILAIIALYRIACVLIEPISEKRITNCITDIANSMTYIFGIAASVAFMFLISITAIIKASNISAMIR